MARITLTIPAQQVGAVLRTLLTLYAVKANAIQYEVNAYLDDERSPATLLEHRDELLAIDDAIDQLGWTLGARVDPIEIVGERELLSEAIHGELARAAENIVEHCETYLHGRCDVEHIRHHADDLNALLDLFAHTETAPELGLDETLHPRP